MKKLFPLFAGLLLMGGLVVGTDLLALNKAVNSLSYHFDSVKFVRFNGTNVDLEVNMIFENPTNEILVVDSLDFQIQSPNSTVLAVVRKIGFNKRIDRKSTKLIPVPLTVSIIDAGVSVLTEFNALNKGKTPHVNIVGNVTLNNRTFAVNEYVAVGGGQARLSGYQIPTEVLVVNENILPAGALGYAEQFTLPSEKKSYVPEIEVRLTRKKVIHTATDKPLRISSPDTAAQLLKHLYNKHASYVAEHFICLYTNNASEVIGFETHSKGAINATVVDVPRIVGIATKLLASGVIVSHNHPSDNIKASDADIQTTRNLSAALKTVGIRLLDHIILTPSYINGESNQFTSLEEYI